MATFYIVPRNYRGDVPDGMTRLETVRDISRREQVVVQPGDHDYVVSGALYRDVYFRSSGSTGSPRELDITIEDNNFPVTIGVISPTSGQDLLQPTFIVPDGTVANSVQIYAVAGVIAPNVQIGAGSSFGMIRLLPLDSFSTIAVGDGARVRYIQTGRGDDVITIGDNVTINTNATWALRSGYGDDNVTIGENLVVSSSADKPHIYLDAGNDTLTIAGLPDNAALSGGGVSGDKLYITDASVAREVAREYKDQYGWSDGPDQDNRLEANGGTHPNGVNVTIDTTRFGGWGEVPNCFTRGTLIETDRGSVRIEELGKGDLVVTRDNGLQAIRWIGMRRVDGTMLAERPEFHPIRIERGALGNEAPSVPLIVSPQHRMLVRSEIAQRMFGTDEVLIAAKQLCELDGISVENQGSGVDYFHILLDQHEIITANGAETETLYTGAQALRSVGPAARKEILALFPELREDDHEPQAARALVGGRRGRRLASRHRRNNKALVN